MSNFDVNVLENENILLRQHIARLKARIKHNNEQIPYLTDTYEALKPEYFGPLLDLGFDIAPLLQGGRGDQPVRIVKAKHIYEIFGMISRVGFENIGLDSEFQKIFISGVFKDENLGKVSELFTKTVYFVNSDRGTKNVDIVYPHIKDDEVVDPGLQPEERTKALFDKLGFGVSYDYSSLGNQPLNFGYQPILDPRYAQRLLDELAGCYKELDSSSSPSQDTEPGTITFTGGIMVDGAPITDMKHIKYLKQRANLSKEVVPPFLAGLSYQGDNEELANLSEEARKVVNENIERAGISISIRKKI